MARKGTTIILCLILFGCGDVFFNETFNKAHEGNVREQLRLAQLYEIGKFTAPDKQKAVHWYAIAAKHGSQIAKDILCWDYKVGCP